MLIIGAGARNQLVIRLYCYPLWILIIRSLRTPNYLQYDYDTASFSFLSILTAGLSWRKSESVDW